MKKGYKDNFPKDFEYEVLYESNRACVQRMYDIHRISPLDARVYYKKMMEKNQSGFKVIRQVVFEDTDGFALKTYEQKYGISITFRPHKSQAFLSGIKYNKKTQEFWWLHQKSVKTLTFNTVATMMIDSEVIKDRLMKEFPWFRTIHENPICWSLSLNTITKHKLYSKRKILNYLFGIPYPSIQFLLEKLSNELNGSSVLNLWNNMKSVLVYPENIHRLPPELKIGDLISITKYASLLNLRVNPSWSYKRMMEETKKMSEIILAAELRITTDIKYNMLDEYVQFGKYFNYRLIDSLHLLITEGIRQKNCVAEYSEKVRVGLSGIYNVEGNTLELKSLNGQLVMGSIRQKSNIDVEPELYERVLAQVKMFNKMLIIKNLDKINKIRWSPYTIPEWTDRVNSMVNSIIGITRNPCGEIPLMVSGGGSIEYNDNTTLMLPRASVRASDIGIPREFHGLSRIDPIDNIQGVNNELPQILTRDGEQERCNQVQVQPHRLDRIGRAITTARINGQLYVNGELCHEPEDTNHLF